MRNGYTVSLDRTIGTVMTEWDRLNGSLYGGHPMLDSRFIDLLLRYFGDGSERLCVIGSEQLPLAMCILRPLGLGLWRSFLPSQAQIGPVLLVNPSDALGFFEFLPGLAVQIDYLCQDPDLWKFDQIESGVASATDHALTMNIALHGSFADYWSGRSKNLVHNVARYQRRLAGDGVSMKFSWVSSPEEVAIAVDRYAALESSGWKGKTGTALEVDNPQGAFYREVMSSFAKTGQASVFELWFGDRLAASRLVINNESMMVILKTTYDESLSRYAPGRLLLRELIQYAFKYRPGGAIEFYTDATQDQLAWATGHRWIRHVDVFRNDKTASVLRFAKHLRQTVITRPNIGLSSGWRIEAFRHPSDFSPEVVRFVDDAERNCIESGSVWYKNFVQTVYPEEEGVFFYVLFKGSLPSVVLPVRIKRRLLGNALESLSNYYTSIYAPILADSIKTRDIVPLFKAIQDSHGPMCEMRFAPMDPASRGYRMLMDALRISGYVPFGFFCFGNWYLKVTDGWVAYWNSREGILRNTVKRMNRKFASEGGVMELVTGNQDLEKALSAFAQVYAASWKRPEPYPWFVPGLVRACAGKGWLRLGIARLKEVPVAAEIWIVAHGKAEIYKLAYHKDYRAYSPGKLLTAFMMRSAIENDAVSEVDYLIGDDPHKKFWMSHRRERWGIVAYNSRTWPGLAGLLREVLGRGAKRFLGKLGIRGDESVG